jgi:Tol biopolymer transport system component
MVWRTVVLATGVGCGAAACGTVAGHEADAAPPSVDAAMIEPDAPPTSKRCAPTAPFQTPVKLTSLDTSASDEGGWLSPDELTIYFDSTRTGTLGGYDIFMATRASRDDEFGNVTPVMGVNDSGSQRNPMVTADGLTMYALIGTAPDYKIGRATRASTSASFGPLVAVPELDSTANDEPNSILPDGSAIYFDSNRSGTYKIYRAPKTATGFGTPLPVSGADLNGAANDDGGVISADELTLFFTSDRPGGVGSNDIWVATRATTADGFGEPVDVQALNTTGLDGVQWLSADGCVVYISSGPCCTYDIFRATRGM